MRGFILALRELLLLWLTFMCVWGVGVGLVIFLSPPRFTFILSPGVDVVTDLILPPTVVTLLVGVGCVVKASEDPV